MQKMIAKEPSLCNHMLPPASVATYDPIRQAIAAVFFRRSRLFVHFHTSNPHHPTQPHQKQAAAIKNSRK